MSVRAVFGATDRVAREGAEDAMIGGASALSTVLTGYFALAGAHPGVLLAPMSLLVYGFGAARALDGRVRQPGLGGKRPRGFREGEPIPEVARVGVPTAPLAAIVALGYDEERRLAAVTAPGIRLAKSVGAARRAWALERLATAGAGAFSDPELHRPFLHLAAPSQGGNVTSADFGGVPEVDKAAQRRATDLGHELVTPWSDEPRASVGGFWHVVGAIDARGHAAILCCREPEGGIEIEPLELDAPRCAEPVRRGAPRVRPGEFLPESAPIAIELDASGRVRAVRAHLELAQLALRIEAPTR